MIPPNLLKYRNLHILRKNQLLTPTSEEQLWTPTPEQLLEPTYVDCEDQASHLELEAPDFFESRLRFGMDAAELATAFMSAKDAGAALSKSCMLGKPPSSTKPLTSFQANQCASFVEVHLPPNLPQPARTIHAFSRWMHNFSLPAAFTEYSFVHLRSPLCATHTSNLP